MPSLSILRRPAPEAPHTKNLPLPANKLLSFDQHHGDASRKAPR